MKKKRIKLTQKEKEFIRKKRKEERETKEDVDWLEQYDNNYCYDENGNWKF